MLFIITPAFKKLASKSVEISFKSFGSNIFSDINFSFFKIVDEGNAFPIMPLDYTISCLLYFDKYFDNADDFLKKKINILRLR